MKKNIPISDLQDHPLQHPVLSDAFIGRVKAYKEILKDVDLDSLPETLDSFRRDSTPETELVIWERIAGTYQLYLAHNPTTDLATKREIYAVLLNASMGEEDWSTIKRLSQDQIDHLVFNYRGLKGLPRPS